MKKTSRLGREGGDGGEKERAFAEEKAGLRKVWEEGEEERSEFAEKRGGRDR